MGDLAHDPTVAPYTLAIVKPDAVAAGKESEILHIAELAGFTVIQQQRLQLTVARAEAFYAEHRERPFFPGLVEFMTSGPVVAAVLAKPAAVTGWRALIGPTNSLDARIHAPKSLRALYGTDGTRNAVHGSDSATSAAREARFFFPKLRVHGAGMAGGAGELDAEAAREYVAEKLQPTLVKALTALSKAKPSSDKAEALEFLARWMLENNANKPRLVMPVGATEAAAAVALEQQRRQEQAEAEMQAAAQDAGAAGACQDGAAWAPSGAGAPQRSLSKQRAEAATKVQAAFRGHQARLEVAGIREAGGAGVEVDAGPQ